jgi:hypothetical protein
MRRGHVEHTVMMRKTYGILLTNLEVKSLLGEQRSMLEENIKIGIKGMVRVSVNWFHVASIRAPWRALVNTVMTFRVP